MQKSNLRRVGLAFAAVAVLAVSTLGLPGSAAQPASAHAAPEMHHAFWRHVPVVHQYFHGPTYVYSYDWYHYRHISFPLLYQSYTYEPIGICVTEYYFYGGAYHCYIG
jgi:hypothetical protein